MTKKLKTLADAIPLKDAIRDSYTPEEYKQHQLRVEIMSKLYDVERSELEHGRRYPSYPLMSMVISKKFDLRREEADQLVKLWKLSK